MRRSDEPHCATCGETCVFVSILYIVRDARRTGRRLFINAKSLIGLGSSSWQTIGKARHQG